MTATSTTSLKRIAGVLLLLALSACTDRRQRVIQQAPVDEEPITNFRAVGDVRFVDLNGQESDIQVYSMAVKGSSLFVTGKPFAFSRWDIGSRPDAPDLTFAVSDLLASNAFSPNIGNWQFGRYASGAVSVFGPLAYLSGELGMSVVNLTNTASPQEVNRYPMAPRNSTAILRDPAYVYTAMVTHPTLPIAYGFSKNDYLYTLSLNNINAPIIRKEAYGAVGSTVCCVTGAAVLGSRVYVSFGTKLWVFGLSQTSNQLTQPRILTQLQAVNVAASATHIYIQHYATVAGSTLPNGIYVFDNNGQNVGYMNLSPIVFSVSVDDAYMYANMDDHSIRIFEMSWKSVPGF